MNEEGMKVRSYIRGLQSFADEAKKYTEHDTNCENDILWCEKHKLETRSTFLCYMYNVKEGIDAKHTPADQMKCETCTFCCRKEKKC